MSLLLRRGPATRAEFGEFTLQLVACAQRTVSDPAQRFVVSEVFRDFLLGKMHQHGFAHRGRRARQPIPLLPNKPDRKRPFSIVEKNEIAMIKSSQVSSALRRLNKLIENARESRGILVSVEM